MAEEMQNAEVRAIQVGETVQGKVTKVDAKQALVDIGYKTEAILPISEVSSLHIEKVADVLSEGDELTLQVTKINEEKDEVIVSKKAVDAVQAWDELEQKFQSGTIFESQVADVVKGGLVVDVGVRGFIPASHVERHFVEDFSDYKGRTLSLKVIELDREKNKVILSHRAVLEDEVNTAKKRIYDDLQVGAVIEGTVQRLTDFGAFVDVGGVDGLVHISELAWERVDKPSDVVNEGDKVKVKVLKVDKDGERISLSMKEAQPGPWQQASQQLKAGSVVTGTVKRLVSFGAFVEVAPGVEGLVHISQISNRHIGNPGEVLEQGQQVQVKILDLNLEEQRISLSIREVEEETEAKVVKKELANYEADQGGMGVTIADRLGDLAKKLKS
ncbi:30S ribosomal protein S1 [Ammoniphilus sp. CFH 90114]|uniref:30S ribosomal protein S1 n=1 Tax=Ammoniphilus sp. CFH 90114 TaxID=2493665 RepID=UPI00100E0511|nr:30S ribosomal protein S1 [Ammoniphilus sp. CFH 90114]RXT13886.1 30S ribosomal protein S1 [Ammoniphilus sp. CFH 90114]